MFAASKSGSVDAKDAQFKNVTMLLHGNGTNGAQNNTFVDSSTNNFTITRNGNTTQGTFTPYGSNWSNYFDGTGDYLTVPSNAAFDFGTGDFTIEWWQYWNSAPATYGNIYSNNYATSPNIVIQTASGLSKYVVYMNGTSTTITESSSATLGVWYHYAVVRNGTTVTIYRNGVSTGSVTYSGNVGSSSVTQYICGDNYVVSNSYVSNFRIVKGTAVYTSAFTPSTTPLTAISGTSLLTCQSNRFIDNSTNNFTITKYGDTSVQRFSPFSPTTAYSTSVIGGSGYFDGSGDYLSAANATALQLSGSQFTIEGWFYYTTSGVDAYLVSNASGSADANVNYVVRITTANKLRFLVMIGSTPTYFDGTTTVTANSWHHFACVCDGSGAGAFLRSWLDGVYQGASSSFNAASINTNAAATQIAAYSSLPSYSTGYVSDLRILKGTALYTGTSNITVPTSPLTAITNTQLLCNFTNAGILDNAMMNDLETVGNAQISTSVKKYGTGSMYFDGTADYLKATNTLISNFGSGAFTVEAWVYFNSVSGTQVIAGNYQSSTVGWSLGKSGSTGYFYASFSGDGNDINGTTTVAINTWYHVAISGTPGATGLKLFVNGVQEGSTYTGAVSLDATTPLYISDLSGLGYGINGYIDDLRITKGYARYTSNFTAPTAAFADKG